MSSTSSKKYKKSATQKEYFSVEKIALSFTTEGEGTLHYYVSGVAAGSWTVRVGSHTQTVTVTEESGLLVFSAPAGTVTLTPVVR